jgi:hypothetical protein
MKVNYQKIYENLGYLFYAIAAADQRVHPAEIEKLRALIAREWLPLENSIDSYGTDAAHYINISFEYLLNEGIPANEAYSVFSDYYQQHQAAFSKDLKKKISTTASAIAKAFADRNKNEKEYIDQLHRLLK